MEVVRQEKEERMLRATENQVNKAQRLMDRDQQEGPNRTWFQTHNERMNEKGTILAAFATEVF